MEVLLPIFKRNRLRPVGKSERCYLSVMDEEAIQDYIQTIVDCINRHHHLGALVSRWQFMLVTQPKVPFASEPHVPNITLTYDLVNDATARRILNDVHQALFDFPYPFRENDNGKYLICYHD